MLKNSLRKQKPADATFIDSLFVDKEHIAE
jgi:hypothetical protein